MKYRAISTTEVVIEVAPFTGAWIEIKKEANKMPRRGRSHPSRVRGLK